MLKRSPDFYNISYDKFMPNELQEGGRIQKRITTSTSTESSTSTSVTVFVYNLSTPHPTSSSQGSRRSEQFRLKLTTTRIIVVRHRHRKSGKPAHRGTDHRRHRGEVQLHIEVEVVKVVSILDSIR